MPTDNLAEKIADLEQARQQIITNRAHWTAVTKPFLLAQLTRISEAFPVGWSVGQGNPGWTNLENISLSFTNSDSGLVEIQTGKSAVKQGGGLVFGQFVNGRVVVMIVYPAVQEFAKASAPKQVGNFDPADIDETFVVRVVGQFLDEMTDWEKTGENPMAHIGF